jgi:cold shock CspA family protein
VHELAGERAAAEAAYQRATTLPRGAFAFFALGRFHLHATQNLLAAATALVEALRRLPSAEPLVRLELARLELACGRPTAALVQVERALACRREGGFTEGLRLAADIAERLGRPADAARYLRQLAQVVTDEPAIASRADALEREPSDAKVPSDATLPPELAILAGATLGTPGRERVMGIVDRFFAEKGFGFLRYGEGQSLFFHVTQCEEGDQLLPGTRVSFVVGHNPKKGKPQAEAVRRSQ